MVLGLGIRHDTLRNQMWNWWQVARVTSAPGQGARLGTRDPFPTIMLLGNRRHIPTNIKELMITLQTTKGLKKK